MTVLQLALVATSTDVMGGHGGRLGFGAVASACVGGYVYAIISTGGRLAPAAAVVCGVSAATLLGAALGWLGTKWGADRYLLTSLTLQVALVETANNLSITGGSLGIGGVPSLLGSASSLRGSVALAAMMAVTIATLSCVTSNAFSFGQWLHWTRDDELSASAAGISPFRARAIAGAVHGGAGAIAGVAIVCVQGYVGPQSFDVWMSLKVVTVVVVAGAAAGPHYMLLASTLLVASSELISFAVSDPAVVGPAQVIVFNAVLVMFLILRRRGIAGPVIAAGPHDAQA
jgi:branched-chain amino acid transport system permease protein